MATTATTRPASGTSRRSPTAAPSPSSPPSSIMKGATARSAVSPRVSSSLTGATARRASLKGAVSPPPASAHQTRETLSESLKQETEQKEKLLVQLQDKEQSISALKAENDNLSSALHAAESRLGDLYADQSRMEEELAARIEVIEKLRSQVRELEKERRDVQRRYNEQTATFEAERQAFYDNEQHLKSRIQSLTQVRKQPPPPVPTSPSVISIVESEVEQEEEPPSQVQPSQDVTDPEQEPAEMTALRLELSTLSTSHTSLQATVALLQSQLVDLKRVNNELQEENESYNILLREKTLSGQYDVLKMGGAAEQNDEDSSSSDEEKDADSYISRNTGRSTLDRVDELSEPEQDDEAEPHPPLDPDFDQADGQDHHSQEDESLNKSTRSRHGRKRSSVAVPRGESLANLPITGPGLDLAAELGRAENKDILDGRTPLDDRTNVNAHKTRRHKKGANSEPGRKVSHASELGAESSASWNDIDALRNEVKSLKDANKALSLYASKIIDRIISQDGFEHVLAVDYEKQPLTPLASTIPQQASKESGDKAKKARPHTINFSSSTLASPNLQQEKLTTFESLREKAPPTPVTTTTASPPTPATASPTVSAPRTSRRSLSFDWKSFSVFGGGEKKPEPSANLRPLTLKAGTPVVTGARKLDTQEDEEDRRERERLHATMKLMGIDKPTPPTSPLPPMLKSFSEPPASTATTSTNSPATATAPTPTSRFSFFRRNSSMAGSSTSSLNSSAQNSPKPPAATPNLTQEALEQAEAENSIAALDAHERQLSAEIAKGAGSGFTEIVRRSGDRRSSRRSHSGSGSTVWSAGMSRHEDDD